MLTWLFAVQSAAVLVAAAGIGWCIRGWSQRRGVQDRQAAGQKQFHVQVQRHASFMSQEISKLRAEVAKLKAEVLTLQAFHRATRARARLPFLGERIESDQLAHDSFPDTQPFER